MVDGQSNNKKNGQNDREGFSAWVYEGDVRWEVSTAIRLGLGLGWVLVLARRQEGGDNRGQRRELQEECTDG